MGIVDRTSREYHLTPSGWVSGTYRYFDTIEGKEVARPSSAVETWVREMRQASMWSREENSERRIWHNESIPQVELDELRSHFPAPWR